MRRLLGHPQAEKSGLLGFTTVVLMEILLMLHLFAK